MFISRHTLKWTKTCRSSGDFPHAHTAHFLLNRHTWVAERPHPVAHVDLRTPMRAGRREPFRRVGGRRRHRRRAAACTPRSSGAPVSPWPGIVPDETAAASVAAQEAMFSRLPAAARTGATHDDGTEFARHAGLRDEPGMATYFADPYS